MRKRRFAYPAAVLMILAFMGAESESCSTTTEEEDPKVESGGKESKAKVAKVGDKVTLKGTTYQVTDVSTASTLGESEFDRVEANGKFVVVKIRLTNRKDEPATILESSIRLIGGNDKNYSTSDDAILATGGQTFLLEEIQPDNTEKGTLVYDLPTKALKGAVLQVEDLFSDSKARIKLGL